MQKEETISSQITNKHEPKPSVWFENKLNLPLEVAFVKNLWSLIKSIN